MMVSKPMRHGLFKPETLLQANPKQQSVDGDDVGIMPGSNLIVLQEKSR